MTKDTLVVVNNIRHCTCVYPYQDKVYGQNMRVFTVGLKAYTCTVCGNKHIIK